MGIGILFQDALLFDHFSVGFRSLAAGRQTTAARRAKFRRSRLERAGLAGFYSPAIRRHSPAASAPASACSAPCCYAPAGTAAG